MVTIFALAAALLYGSADFLGGVATRRARALAILPASTLAGLVVVLVAAMAAGESVSQTGLAWGVAAGAVGGIGLIVFYAGLAEGPMTIVAPTSALTATVLPVAVSIADGERASASVYAGALICLAAVVLVSTARSPAAAAAAGDGAAEADETADRATRCGAHVGLAPPCEPRPPPGDSGLPRAGYRIRRGCRGDLRAVLHFLAQRGPIRCVVADRRVQADRVRDHRDRRRHLAGQARDRCRRSQPPGGGFRVRDPGCHREHLLRARHQAGLFGLAVVLTSLYPGITVVLARFVLHERMRLPQRAGLLLAAAGVVLVTV